MHHSHVADTQYHTSCVTCFTLSVKTWLCTYFVAAQCIYRGMDLQVHFTILQVMILYGSVYELFMWIYYGASDHWVYNAVTWHSDKSVVVYVLLPLAYVVLFFVW